MNRREWGISCIALFLISILMGVGCYCLRLSGPPSIQALLLQKVVDQPQMLGRLGWFCCALSMGTFALLAWVCRTPYYTVQMARGTLAIAPPVIQKAVHTYWRQTFSDATLLPQVVCEGNQITVHVDTSQVTPQLLRQVEAQLGPVLECLIGEQGPFFLTVR